MVIPAVHSAPKRWLRVASRAASCLAACPPNGPRGTARHVLVAHDKVPARGARRVRLVRGEGRGVSASSGVRDAACPLGTRGEGGGVLFAREELGVPQLEPKPLPREREGVTAQSVRARTTDRRRLRVECGTHLVSRVDGDDVPQGTIWDKSTHKNRDETR